MRCWFVATECKYCLALDWWGLFRSNMLCSYVWGDDVAKAKTQCESLDYLFQLAVEMHKLGLPWVK